MSTESTPMTNIQFTDKITATLIDHSLSDERVCIAARTSTAGIDANPAANSGLINSLMKNRHGSPFEHMSATWQVKAPLFVWREHHRHRIASYSEESGRYKQLEPEFYLPNTSRPLVQTGKPMDYNLQPGNPDTHIDMRFYMRRASVDAYMTYQNMLDRGIAREVARMVLPLNIMSTCIVSMNARGLMNFLSLRVDSPGATFQSKPMLEIQTVAEQYEEDFAELAPLTHSAFITHGRVAP